MPLVVEQVGARTASLVEADHLRGKCRDTVDVFCVTLRLTWFPQRRHVSARLKEVIRLVRAIEVLEFGTSSETVDSTVNVASCLAWDGTELEAEA
jgi:hypothetical protein